VDEQHRGAAVGAARRLVDAHVDAVEAAGRRQRAYVEGDVAEVDRRRGRLAVELDNSRVERERQVGHRHAELRVEAVDHPLLALHLGSRSDRRGCGSGRHRRRHDERLHDLAHGGSLPNDVP